MITEDSVCTIFLFSVSAVFRSRNDCDRGLWLLYLFDLLHLLDLGDRSNRCNRSNRPNKERGVCVIDVHSRGSAPRGIMISALPPRMVDTERDE